MSYQLERIIEQVKTHYTLPRVRPCEHGMRVVDLYGNALSAVKQDYQEAWEDAVNRLVEGQVLVDT